MREITWKTNLAGWPVIPAPPFEGQPPPYVDIALTRIATEKDGPEECPEYEIERRTYEIRVWYEPSESGLVIRGIEADDLTSPILKAIGIGDLRKQISATLKDHPERLTGVSLWGKLIEDGIEAGTAKATPAERDYLREALVAAERAIESHKRSEGPGRGRGVNHDFYREIALRYIATLKHHPHNPVKVLAETSDVPPSKMSVWVRDAREYGWLSKRDEHDPVSNRHLSQGKPYGAPGPRLEEWLREQGETA